MEGGTVYLGGLHSELAFCECFPQHLELKVRAASPFPCSDSAVCALGCLCPGVPADSAQRKQDWLNWTLGALKPLSNSLLEVVASPNFSRHGRAEVAGKPL